MRITEAFLLERPPSLNNLREKQTLIFIHRTRYVHFYECSSNLTVYFKLPPRKQTDKVPKVALATML
jgi:hypothetical protein